MIMLPVVKPELFTFLQHLHCAAVIHHSLDVRRGKSKWYFLVNLFTTCSLNVMHEHVQKEHLPSAVQPADLYECFFLIVVILLVLNLQAFPACFVSVNGV